MKRILSIALVVILAAALFASCKSGKPSTETTTAQTPAETTAPEATTEENTPAEDETTQAPAPSSDVAGTYVVKTVDGLTVEEVLSDELEENLMTMEDYLDLFEINAPEEIFVIELKADGSAKGTVAGEGSGYGDWTLDGDTLTITLDDEPMDCVLNGNEITFEIDGQVWVLIKR